MTVKAQLMDLLAQVETLLEEASCEGQQLAELDEVFEDVNSKFNALAETIDYYVD